jgi:hypothetical protein
MRRIAAGGYSEMWPITKPYEHPEDIGNKRKKANTKQFSEVNPNNKMGL